MRGGGACAALVVLRRPGGVVTPPASRVLGIPNKQQKETPAMLKQRAHTPINEISESTRISQVKTYKTPAGPLFLRNNCSPAFVESLQVDEGLRAFARLPEREHQLLLSIAQKPQNRLTLAYTANGNIVGQATLAPLDNWWQDIGNAYEIAVEVSPDWRKLGIAHCLLSYALEFKTLEEYLILGLGLSWHWDYEGLGITRFHYRELIARLFAAHGFTDYLTSEPNIRMDPANILVARLGSRLPQESINRFFQHLLHSETLPGL
jgi:GNAT superfamily N-acetyltransferase